MCSQDMNLKKDDKQDKIMIDHKEAVTSGVLMNIILNHNMAKISNYYQNFLEIYTKCKNIIIYFDSFMRFNEE